MEYTTLGRMGLKVSVAGLGCGGPSRLGQGSGVPEAEARRLLVYAFASEMIEQVQLPELREALFPCLNLATSIKK